MLRWVPETDGSWEADVPKLSQSLRGLRVCVLSGAGASTESGIPDYRGGGTERRARSPVPFKKFVESDAGRRRYWARSMMGWPRMRHAQPNQGHLAVARLERGGAVTGVITQNVDGLHQKGGAQTVIELHGCLHQVVCLDCGRREHRDDLQARLLSLNPDFAPGQVEFAPDGDADLPDDIYQGFRDPGCRGCSGILKPDVVFFGESVPQAVIADAFALLDASDALLVVGSSLTVFSGYRFVRQAHREAKPVFVVNVGATRADDLAELTLSGPIGPVLQRLSETLAP